MWLKPLHYRVGGVVELGVYPSKNRLLSTIEKMDYYSILAFYVFETIASS